jgi:hypothetical protein
VRPATNLTVERYRVRSGPYASSREDGNNGQFLIPLSSLVDRIWALCMVSDGEGWEHVSVSVYRSDTIRGRTALDRCPTWEEMCQVKDLFWQPEEATVQFHPRRSQYRNLHQYVLHIWRPTELVLPEPNADFVAPRDGESVEQAVARFKETA